MKKKKQSVKILTVALIVISLCLPFMSRAVVRASAKCPDGMEKQSACLKAEKIATSGGACWGLTGMSLNSCVDSNCATNVSGVAFYGADYRNFCGSKALEFAQEYKPSPPSGTGSGSGSSGSGGTTTTGGSGSSGGTGGTTTTGGSGSSPKPVDPNEGCKQTSIIDVSGDCSGTDGGGIWALLNLILDIMTGGVGILAIAGIATAAVIYITAEGSPDRLKKAKTWIFNVVLGLILYGLLYVLANFLIPGGLFK